MIAIWVRQSLLRHLVLVAAVGAAMASAAADDSQRLEERLPTVTEPPADTAAPAPPPSPAAQADYATFPPFTLQLAAVDGATALTQAEIGSCTEHLVGATVGPVELVDLTRCITRLYRDRDFFLSRAIIPPQQVVDGVLQVRVIEGFIAAVAPKGIDQVDADAQFASTLRERPTRLSTFERDLLLLADRYGYRIAASELAPDPNDPARYTFNLAVAKAPISARIYADNRGTEAHGPEQAFGWIAWNAVFGPSDRLAASIFLSPTAIRELLYAEANYARGWSEGALWTEIGASVSRTHDGSMPSILGERSDTDRLYGRITVPIVRSRAHSLWASFMLDARHAEQVKPLSTTDEDTRVIRGGLSYTLIDGPTRGDVLLEVSRGLDALGASSNGDPALSRADARPSFTKARLEGALLHKLAERWDVVLTATGQWADGALVASEEFGGGGARFGRAYDYSEIIGDSGVAGAVELRWTWPAAFGLPATLQLYGFADGARIWNVGWDATQRADADLTSAGGGLRLSPFAAMTATLEVAKPLSRDVATEGDRSPRVFVSLSAGW